MSKIQKIFEIKSLNADKSKLSVKTVNGTLYIQWDSITHAYIFNLKGYSSVLKPAFAMNIKESSGSSYLLILPAEKTGSIKMVIDGKIIMKMLMSKISLDQTIDPIFTEVVTKLTDHFTWTYIDAPLKNFISSGNINFPLCENEQQISEYCGRLEEGLASGGEESLKESLKEIHSQSSPVTSREKLTIGSEIDGIYTVKKILSGGMGVVYVIDDKERNKTYALKTFKDEFIYDVAVCNQFIKEAEIWTKVGKHKNIVQAERVMLREGQPYIFLEFIDGKELEEIIHTEGHISAKDAINYSMQLCSGMSYAWNLLGLIHRDLKPANCFITKDGTLKISDFGLGTVSMSKDSSSGDEMGSAIVGTFPYMAPELFMGGNMASTQTDIYAFGIILSEMLTGVNPFYDEDPSEIIDRHMNLESSLFDNITDEVTPELDFIYKKCIAKDPAERYSTFEEIYEDLAPLYEEATGAEFKATYHETFSEEDYIKRGLSLANLRQYAEALKVFDEAIKINPRTPALLHKGKTLAAAGKYSEAIEALDAFIEQHKSYWRAWLYKADAYTSSKQYQYAEECLMKAEEMNSGNPEILAAKGRLKSELGEIGEAIQLCEESLSLDEKKPETWFLLGSCYMSQRKMESAKDAFAEASSLNPRYIEALEKGGECCRHIGFYKEATKAYKRALSLDKDNSACLLGLTELSIETGDIKAASDYCSKLFSKGIPSPEAVIAKAHILQSQDHDEDAINLLTEYMSRYPADKRLKLKLAEIYLKISDPLTALGIFTELFQAPPQAGTEEEGIFHSVKSKIEYNDRLSEEITGHRAALPEKIFESLNTLISFAGSIDFAIRISKRMEPLCPDISFKIRTCLAILLSISGKQQEASCLHKALLAEKPKDQFLTDIGRMLFPTEKDNGIFQKMELNKFLKTPDANLIDALIESYSGDMQTAVYKLENLYAKYPSMTCALIIESNLKERMAEKEAAENLRLKFITAYPQSLGYYRIKLLNARKKRMLTAIEEVVKHIANIIPYLPEIWLYYINILIEYGHISKSVMTAEFYMDNFLSKTIIPRNSAEFKKISGFLNFVLRRYEAAKNFYMSALDSSPEDITSICALARCHIALSNDQEAIRLLKSEPAASSPAAKCVLASTSEGSDIGSLMSITGSVKEPSETDEDMLLLKKMTALYESGEQAKAALIARSLIKHYPSLPFANYCILKTTPGIRVEDVYPASKLDTDNSYILKTAASAYLEKKDYIKAETLFKKIISTNPFDAEARNLLGIVYYRTRRYMEAADAFSSALNDQPMNPQLRVNLGAAYWHINEHEKMERAFETAGNMKYISKNATANLSLYYIETGNPIRAKQFAEKALREDKTYYPAWIARGRALMRYGNNDDALASAESAIANNQSDPRGWILKSSIQIESGDTQEGIYNLRKVAEINSEEPVIWYNLALANLKEGKNELAFTYIQQALKLRNAFFEAVFLYGTYLYVSGQKDKYSASMAKAKQLNPNKYARYAGLIQRKHNIWAPLKTIDTSSEPFCIVPYKEEHQPAIFRMTDCTPIFFEDRSI